MAVRGSAPVQFLTVQAVVILEAAAPHDVLASFRGRLVFSQGIGGSGCDWIFQGIGDAIVVFVFQTITINRRIGGFRGRAGLSQHRQVK